MIQVTGQRSQGRREWAMSLVSRYVLEQHSLSWERHRSILSYCCLLLLCWCVLFSPPLVNCWPFVHLVHVFRRFETQILEISAAATPELSGFKWGEVVQADAAQVGVRLEADGQDQEASGRLSAAVHPRVAALLPLFYQLHCLAPCSFALC